MSVPYSYKSLADALSRVGIENAKYEASLLLCRFCDTDRARLLSDRDKLYTSDALDAAVLRRLERYPLQYILGEWEFFGCTFRVDENCLIPRPDTETLVEAVLQRERLHKEGLLFADLCTGSGCIAVSLLAILKDSECAALELYEKTLDIAKGNAALNEVQDRFIPIRADLLCGGASELERVLDEKHRQGFDFIVSNPPYIPTADISSLEPELDHEPFAALDGGDDGLIFYRAIIKDYSRLVRRGGRIYLEIGADQAEDVGEIAKSELGGCSLTVIKDLGGNDRVVIIELAE